MDKYVVILAAGKGTGMNSRDPEHSKVSYPILGKPIINYVIDSVKTLDPKQIVTVVGFGGELTKKLVEKDSDVVWQKRLLGTGHAVLQAKPFLEGKPGQTLVIYGDTPLVETDTLRSIFHIHEKNRYDMTVVSAILDNPKGYGRILREDKSNRILAIREESDCTFHEYEINEVNTGICIINNELLFKYIERLSVDNSRHLFYLSELVEL
jgi:bifunctional UDP-N-acetylglucosamine pyrophosphorylase/glucosamine-1-phosphate N-acetyltransferase